MAAAVDESTDREFEGTRGKHKVVWSKYKNTIPSKRTPLGSFPSPSDGSLPHNTQQAVNNLAQHIAHTSSIPNDPTFDQHHHNMVEDEISRVLSQPLTHVAPPPFTLEDVKNVCGRVRLKTALGPDNMSPYFLRHGGGTLHSALFLFFSICFGHGFIPSAFVNANVVTLYKGEGNVNDPNNYRPIAITSVIMRVWERLIQPTLLNVMQQAGIPAPHQFGFTKQRSTHDAIFRLLATMVDSFEHVGQSNPFVPVVFVDIAKAYDRVWIHGLLYKLHAIGVKDHLLHFFRAFLTNRTIQVIHSGLKSITVSLTAGVPQGSVLAPFLFIVYIHSISVGIPRSICVSLFADDIALLPTISGTAGLAPLQRALDVMSSYASCWKITYSSSKTNVVFFRPPRSEERRRGAPPPQHTLTLSSFPITTAASYTYLGITLDSNLTFIPHLQQLVSSSTSCSIMIARLVKRDCFPSFPVVRTLVACVLVPKIVYGFPFLHIANKVSTVISTSVDNRQQHSRKNLFRQLKNNMLRPLQRSLGLPHNAQHFGVFVESRLLPIESLQCLQAAMLVHRWLNLPASSGNEAPHLLRVYLARPSSSSSLPQIHPYTRLLSFIARCPELMFNPSAPATFASIPRQHIRSRVWHSFFTSWRADADRSLPKCYVDAVVPELKQLPPYLQHDHPTIAARRARLRFNRGLLNHA
ncbi:reverse transcriptase family protein, partial [Janthinobacterium sp.]|uniref:RNA-directed DNA polymerase n=1 Tax=Janthinobacterium sp. TaxID=1871054 RepID=UPI00293D4ADF